MTTPRYPCLHFAGHVHVRAALARAAGMGRDERRASRPAAGDDLSCARSWRLGDCRVTGGYLADGTRPEADSVIGGRLVVASAGMVAGMAEPSPPASVEPGPEPGHSRAISLHVLDTGGAQILKGTTVLTSLTDRWPGWPPDDAPAGTVVESELSGLEWPEPAESALVRQLRAITSAGRLRIRLSLDSFERELDPPESTNARVVGSIRPHQDGAQACATVGRERGSEARDTRASIAWSSLTPAELHVVALLAQGLTSREIGEALYVSRRTVESHLDHAYRKLGLSSRVQVAAEVLRRMDVEYP